MKHFLITGATGFIGQSYVEALKREDVKITLLSRPKSVKKTKKLFPDIDVISVDLEQGISEGLEIQFLETVTDIVHVAGGYDIEMSFEEAYISNILVSQNLCQLIKKIKCDKTVHLISSFSVVGNREESLKNEDELCIDETKMSNYSFSKAKVEEYFRKNIEHIGGRLRIYRPGIVIESRIGRVMEKIDGPYYFSSTLIRLKNLLRPMLFLCIPFSKQARLPLVSIECLTKNLVLSTTKPVGESMTRCYFFFSQKQFNVGDLIKLFLSEFGVNAKVIPLPKFNSFKNLTKALGIPNELYDFMFMNNRYDFSCREMDFPNWCDEKIDYVGMTKKIILSTPVKEKGHA